MLGRMRAPVVLVVFLAGCLSDLVPNKYQPPGNKPPPGGDVDAATAPTSPPDLGTASNNTPGDDLGNPTADMTPQPVPQSVKIGETNILNTDDSGNANMLLAQSAPLAATAKIQSLSFYVSQAAGNLRLGIYDSTGPNNGPGTKLAETDEITPVTGFNTAPVTTPVTLPAGTYWLAYFPSDNNLHFVNTNDGNAAWYNLTYGPMPTTFSTTTTTGTVHWSFYATLLQ